MVGLKNSQLRHIRCEKKKFMSRVPNSFSSVLLFWTERRISEMQSHKVQYCNLVRHRRRPVVYCHVAKPKFKTTTTVPPNLRASSVLEKFAFLRCLLNNKYLNFCWLEIHLTIIKCLKSTKECIKSLEAKIQWSILEFSKWPIAKVFLKEWRWGPFHFKWHFWVNNDPMGTGNCVVPLHVNVSSCSVNHLQAWPHSMEWFSSPLDVIYSSTRNIHPNVCFAGISM